MSAAAPVGAAPGGVAKNPLFRYHLGAAYEFQSPSKARDELTRALALDPNFPGAVDAKAMRGRLGSAR